MLGSFKHANSGYLGYKPRQVFLWWWWYTLNVHSPTLYLPSWIQAVKMLVECSTCHALFSRRDAMMRHRRLKQRDVEEDEDVDMVDNSPEHSDADNDGKKDNIVFSQMVEKAHDYTADEWLKKYDKYRKQNMPEKKANSKADEKTRGETYQHFRKLYDHFLYDLY
jgi:hypothetical protein